MLGVLVLAAALGASAGPTVHVMLHVPLQGPALGTYRRKLEPYGRVIGHPGSGTWTASHDPAAPLVSEAVDHIEVVTRLGTALSFLPRFLHAQRIAQKQTETLGEIFGGAYGTPRQTRTRIVVRIAAARATPALMTRLHRVFSDNGDGGDSLYVTHGVAVDYSGVRPEHATRIERQLEALHVRFRIEQETFMTDDAGTP